MSVKYTLKVILISNFKPKLTHRLVSYVIQQNMHLSLRHKIYVFVRYLQINNNEVRSATSTAIWWLSYVRSSLSVEQTAIVFVTDKQNKIITYR